MNEDNKNEHDIEQWLLASCQPGEHLEYNMPHRNKGAKMALGWESL